MRGTDVHQEGLFSYLSPESRIPQRHPLRPVREMVSDIALSEKSGQFESPVLGHGTSLDSAGEVVAGIAAADPVFDSQ